MNFPDYDQLSTDHARLLVLIRGIGPNKPRSLQKIFERIQKIDNVKIKDSAGQTRDIFVRYVRDHAVENNDWGDFQTHRRLLGLITVGRFDSQGELNELCRVHESLKVKYTSTLYDSRALLFAPATTSNNDNDSKSIDNSYTSESSLNGFKLENEEQKILVDNNMVMPTIFKSRGFFYTENSTCPNLESRITDFINSLFWILESKRLERTKEKFDKVSLLLAPFEKKDFVGLDMESRNNKKRIMGRITKNLADLTLQCGLIAESLNYYHAATETLRSIGDSLWLGGAQEGICASSAIILYPHLRHSVNFHRNISLQGNPNAPNQNSSSPQKNLHRASDGSKQIMQHRKFDMKINLDKSNNQNNESSSTTSSGGSSATTVSNSSSTNSLTSSNESEKKMTSNGSQNILIPSNVLQPDEITSRYREAIINYSKYRMAGIIETEAALKAARICIEQNQNLDVAMFLQNVLYINLNMNEQEKVRRFETLTELYQQIGYHRKAAFCQRLAAWRHIAQNNTNPDWAASYRLMLDSFRGHKLSLEPTEVLETNQGWPCLQIDLLQQLIGASRRLGQSALATRHMTFLLQTQWKNLSPSEQKEMALQLQNLSSQCEGSPVPLFLENGTFIPPANLTDLPFCETFELKDLSACLRPHKIQSNKVDSGPFLFTPIHFNSSIDRRTAYAKKRDREVSFLWVQHEKSEIAIKLLNPLPFELQVSDMRLLSDGIVFESLPESIVLPANASMSISLFGTPLEVGELEINGYSTHTLGVKSNCRLKHMFARCFPVNYRIKVIPALPKMNITTSIQQSTLNCLLPSEEVINTATLTLYNGETQICEVTLENTSNIPIETIDASLSSGFDQKLQNRIVTFDIEEIRKQLPIEPGKKITFNVKVYGDADFVGPIIPSTTGGGISSSLTPHQNDLPSSLSGVNSLLSHSRVGSPIQRRNNEHNMSFRSSTTASGATVNSGHSSLATLSLGAIMNGSNQTRQLEFKLIFKYSGGLALSENHCRHCALLFNVELIPSLQVTNWDVLPAEVSSQFYLVLDIANLTTQEVSLNYPNNKTILIEPKESCRVPVPVERCPLDKILSDYQQQQQQLLNSNECGIVYSGTFNSSDVDLPEKLCSEHIASLVNLKWQLSPNETCGIASLRGISLSSTMLDLVTVAPIQFDVRINDKVVSPSDEFSVSIGTKIMMEINVSNNQVAPLQNLILTAQFYQDFQNGVTNYRLETRVTMSGPNYTFITSLSKNDVAKHQCSAIFFTPGRFKVDIQCKTQSSSSGLSTVSSNDTHHTWKFIPPLEVLVVN
ncbi:protein brunelleschi isoform X2 [Chironomus tepperi]